MRSIDTSKLIEFDERGLEQLDRAMNRVLSASDKDPELFVRDVAGRFTRRCLSATPMAGRKITGRTPNDIVVDRTGGSRVARPATYSDRGRPIGHRGFAKSSWIGAAHDLRARVSLPKSAESGGARRHSRADWLSRKARAAVDIVNRHPYIMDLDQGSRLNPPYHILAVALGKTVRDLERKYDWYMRRQQRAWSK